MSTALHRFLGILGGAVRDLAPIVLVIAFFQIVVLRQPFPDLGGVIGGLICVVLGLALFVQGLEMGLFPIGEAMAQAMARKGSLPTLLLFAFALGFGTLEPRDNISSVRFVAPARPWPSTRRKAP